MSGSDARSTCARVRGGGAPGEIGGGTRDGRDGGCDNRSTDDGGDCDRGESLPSLIIGIGRIESDAGRAGGMGLDRLGGSPGRGGSGDCRAPGRTLGNRGFGGGLLRVEEAPASPPSSTASAPNASALRGVGTWSCSLSSLIDFVGLRGK
jgi:hypothetical protein